MDLLLETNFLLELVFKQEQAAACEMLLQAAEQGKVVLHLPAFSLMEQLYRLAGATKERRDLQAKVQQVLTQAQRETVVKDPLSKLERDFTTLLEVGSQQQQERLLDLSQRVSSVAQLIPLTAGIWAQTARLTEEVELTLSDCVVCASLLERAAELIPLAPKLFVTRDKKGFQQQAVRQLFEEHGCEIILNFQHAVQRLRMG